MQLRLTAEQARRLREHLFGADGRERFAYLRCTATGDRLVTSHVDLVGDEDMATMTATECRPALDVERGIVAECTGDGLAPIMVHSHPFADEAAFSERDEALMQKYYTWLRGLYPDLGFGFIVAARDEAVLRWFPANSDEQATHPAIRSVGSWYFPETDGFHPANDDREVTVDGERYDRSIRCLGPDGQQRLADTRVVVAGVGGLGSHIAEQLARLGVGHLTVIDPDIVEESNLPRIVGAAPHHVGRPKVDVAKEAIYRANPDAEVYTVQGRIEDHENRVAGADIVVAALDEAGATSVLNQQCVAYLSTLVETGTRIDTGDDGDLEAMTGIIQTVEPGVTACYDCLERGQNRESRLEGLPEEYAHEDIDRGYVDAGILEPEPAITTLNLTVAGLTCQTVLKLRTGYAEPGCFIRYDGLTDETRRSLTTPNPECATCGNNGILGHGGNPELTADTEGLDLDMDFAENGEDEQEGRPTDERPQYWGEWFDNGLFQVFEGQ
ncbi:ThiF family adenylyltransferase [Halogeometricum borinquense]|uniref:ThiF family adenylyltransferase n=1 Tax=Halogeometricum borinquense TaxID=60847 RepID=A0A6C0UJJ3_9EURY|nr:ThiF family adenylyltransferase [Halogeometricum borinquense]QIB75387.1 ThiF family adenylyltransferase [Halogeometricum borinquense]